MNDIPTFVRVEDGKVQILSFENIKKYCDAQQNNEYSSTIANIFKQIYGKEKLDIVKDKFSNTTLQETISDNNLQDFSKHIEDGTEKSYIDQLEQKYYFTGDLKEVAPQLPEFFVILKNSMENCKKTIEECEQKILSSSKESEIDYQNEIDRSKAGLKSCQAIIEEDYLNYSTAGSILYYVSWEKDDLKANPLLTSIIPQSSVMSGMLVDYWKQLENPCDNEYWVNYTG